MSLSTMARCVCHDQAPVIVECDAPDSQLCSGCRKLAEIQKQIAEARELLRTLIVDREACIVEINASHDKLTRALPLELCSRIFTSAVEQRGTTPFLLASVSTIWRNIAFRTPEAWARLSFNLTPRKPGRYEEIKAMVTELLQRSRRQPLTLSLSADAFTSMSMTRPSSIVQALRGHCSRWSNLHISAPEEVVDALLWNCESAIESLSINIGHTSNPAYLRFSTSTLSAPTFVTVSGSWSFYSAPIQWKNVTQYNCTLANPMDTLKVLQNAPCLETLDFHPAGDATTILNLSKQEIVEARNIRTLRVRGRPDVLMHWFQQITLPSLSELVLDSLSFTGLDNFLRRSKCSITCFSAEICDAGYYIGALSLMPDLQDLKVNSKEVGYLVHLIKVMNTSASFLQDLRRLELICSTPGKCHIDETVILKLLHSKQRKIRHFDLLLTFTEDIPDTAVFKSSTIKNLQGLLKRGFNLQIRSLSGNFAMPQDHLQHSLNWHKREADKRRKRRMYR